MEEKKYPIGGFAPRNYHNRCTTCERSFFGDKRAVQCEPCALEAKARFDALDPNDKELLIKRNARIANYMFSGPLSAERDLIYRIVEEWGNAIEMPNMEQWLKDYAATRQPCAMWVKASEFKTNEPVFRPFRRKREDGVPEYDYGEIYVTEDNGEIFLDINNERSYEPQHFERWKDYEILDESPTPAADWAKYYDTLYYIVMPVLNKLRHRTDNDTRMMERGGDIRDTIHKALADIKKLPSPISSNEPPFLVQSEASPAAGREEDAISKEVLEFIRDIAYNWDCDEDGHKYNTGCRKCNASELLYDLTRKRHP